ncbi:MAG TPA: flagellar brake domain-containing protein [Candidatus Limnocylindrales bacterium]|nr:flagellar brake domain-containing protein [Candidatus Limnocylindrales bacterium]
MDASVLLRNIFPPSSEVVVEFVNQVGVLEKYLSRVEDLESDYLLLQTPLVDKVPVLILEGQELTLRRLEVRSKQVYVVSVFVIENRPGKIPLLVCSKPKEINKISFRRFFRFKVDLPLVYTAGRIAFSGRVTDLSLRVAK